MDCHQKIQEEQYSFPYHYLPSFVKGNFSQNQYWSWGYRYLGRLQVVFDLLCKVEFESLIDIGCGDGRFLKEVNTRFSQKRLLGIDYSETAIALAKRMNPDLRYEYKNILSSSITEIFDVVTLLEVIEHIPAEKLRDFMSAVSNVLRPGGYLIITTPHTNVRLIPKHFQHFNSTKLKELLRDGFDQLQCIPFDYISLFLRVFLRLLGGSGKYFIITQPEFNNAFFRYYMKHCLYGTGEAGCHRIACVAQKNNLT